MEIYKFLPSRVVVGAGVVVVVPAVEEEELERRTVSTMELPRRMMARHLPSSSLYLTTALISATTMPGPRIAPMYLTVMLPVVLATRLWQSVMLSTR